METKTYSGMLICIENASYQDTMTLQHIKFIIYVLLHPKYSSIAFLNCKGETARKKITLKKSILTVAQEH